MNRKIMSSLSYGFYFLVLCIVFLIIYLAFFKQDNKNNSNSNSNTSEKEEENIKNENIKLNSNEISLDIGASFNLSVTLTPSSGDEIIKFESENENIATVNELGVVSGVGSGSTKIIVSVEGTNLKAECNVNVSETIVTVTSLFSKDKNVNLKINETYQTDITVIPMNSTDKSLTYSSSNDSVAEIDSQGLITAKQEGTAFITVSSAVNKDVTVEIKVLVK